MGGVWERQIRNVRNILSSLSVLPLTPNNLLTMKSKLVLSPPGQFQRSDVYSRKRWRRVQYLANEFWLRWQKEYLQTLLSRSKWVAQRRNSTVGDVVIIRDENLPRNQWHLGRVVETYKGKDGLVRKVKVLVGTSVLSPNGKCMEARSYLERPIHKLVLIQEALH